MNTGFILMTLMAHTVPYTADLRAYLLALRDLRPEPEICALGVHALDNYDALIDRGFDGPSIVRALGDLVDARRPDDLRARVIETLNACGGDD